MRVAHKWTPVLVSLLATPLFLLWAVIFAGGGHGSYLPAKILFPYAMLLAIPRRRIILPFFLLLVAQYPLYGILYSLVRGRRLRVLLTLVLVIAHVWAAAACFLTGDEAFS